MHSENQKISLFLKCGNFEDHFGCCEPLIIPQRELSKIIELSLRTLVSAVLTKSCTKPQTSVTRCARWKKKCCAVDIDDRKTQEN